MKIHLAKSAGFCFGVTRALKIALEESKKGKNIEMLGDIVHNEDVVAQVKKAGIRKIDRLGKGELKTLLIRAHGTGERTFAKARSLGYTIVDATCPMVKEIHRTAKTMEQNGYRIIIIGDKNHDEVKGIMGQLHSQAIVINEHSPLPLKKISALKKVAVVVQSTQNQETVERIVEKLTSCARHTRFFNTICRPTRTKQAEIKTMPLENDLMIVIGSKSSANTKRLFEIARSLNKKSYWIQSKDELDMRWFKGVRSVGITSGSSTPAATTREVIRAIQKMG